MEETPLRPRSFDFSFFERDSVWRAILIRLVFSAYRKPMSGFDDYKARLQSVLGLSSFSPGCHRDLHVRYTWWAVAHPSFHPSGVLGMAALSPAIEDQSVTYRFGYAIWGDQGAITVLSDPVHRSLEGMDVAWEDQRRVWDGISYEFGFWSLVHDVQFSIDNPRAPSFGNWAYSLVQISRMAIKASDRDPTEKKHDAFRQWQREFSCY